MAIRVAGAAILGVVLGYGATLLPSLQWVTLVPWALGAMAVGAISLGRRDALIAGAIYGFLVGFTFMVAGYTGTDPIAGKLPFFAVIGVVSAAVASTAAFVGWWRWHGWGRHAGA